MSVLRVWKGEKAKGKIPISTLLTPLHLPHMEKATGCANCLGTALECCRRQTCNPWLLPPAVNQSFYLHFICAPLSVPGSVGCSGDWMLSLRYSHKGAGNRSGTESTAGIPAHAGTSPAGPSQWNSTRRAERLSFTYRKQEMCQASLTVLCRRCPAAMLSPQPRHLQTSSPAHSNKGTNRHQFTAEKTKIGTSFIKNNLKLSN